MAAHARLSASGAERWMVCPASITFTENVQEKRSEYAEEGTLAHELAESILAGKKPVKKPTVEMLAYVQHYVDYIRSLKGELFIEQRVDFSNVVPSGFGTSDAIVIDADQKTMWIVDLKYGQGVKVNAENNPQLQLYAIGALNTYDIIYDIDTVHLVVVQPRLDHISEWQTTTTDLRKFGEYVAERAALVDSENPPFNPAEKACKFCKGKSSCRALAAHNLKIARMEFGDEDATPVDPKELTEADLAFILPHIALIKSWCSDIEETALSSILSGKQIEGFKVVAGRSTRQWADEEQAADKLKGYLNQEELFNQKIISPTQAEKLLGKSKSKEALDGLVVKPSGKPTVVPVTDKREPYNSAQSDFTDES
jgi:CRISPR/Cas system-associated exonuclease Cas4 (RecB family)